MDSNPQPATLLILAAGNSSRLGKPKQLLPVGSEVLLTHQLRTWSRCGADHTFVVLGSRAEQLRALVDEDAVRVVINPEWRSGMGSSLVSGVQNILLEIPDAQGILVVLVDQYRLAPRMLSELLRIGRGSNKLTAAHYNRRAGVPAFFPKRYFAQLLAIPPQQGAKFILQKCRSEMIRYPLPAAAFDVDTPEDLVQFKSFFDDSSMLSDDR